MSDSSLAIQNKMKDNKCQLVYKSPKKWYFKGTLIFEATVKMWHMAIKKKYFSCTYTFFVVPLCVINK